MANLNIPLEVNPYYFFSVTLEEDLYKLSMRWNFLDSAWYMDIENLSTSKAVRGIKLITGVNLLRPYAFYELGSMFMIDLEGQNEDPNFEDIGTRFCLAYVEK